MGLETGWGDLQGLLPPRAALWSIELKYDAGRPSGDQLERQTESAPSRHLRIRLDDRGSLGDPAQGWRAAPASLAEPVLPSHTGWQRHRIEKPRVSKRVQKAGATLFRPL